tara:strand:+ start:1359 stop:2177 length:819 start_codon:yes stop_codon:yes gene_type:complete
MKKIFIIFSIFSLLAAEKLDVIYKTDGSIIKGHIIEEVPSEYIILESGLNTFKIQMSEIEKISFEENQIDKDKNTIPLVGIIGGVTYSKIKGDSRFGELENLSGYKLGFQKETKDFIFGAAYTQRGFSSENIEENSCYYYYGSSNTCTYSSKQTFTFNYITAYLLKPIAVSSEFSLLAGLETGYFRSGELKSKVNINTPFGDESDSDTMEVDADDWENQENEFIDYGAILGVSYKINNKMSIVANYYLGLSNLNSDPKIKNNSMQFYLVYGL